MKRVLVREPMGRPRSSTIVGLFLIAGLLCCIAAGAQEQRVALVIGNGRYQHIATLVNPPNDAADMAAALKKDGFTVTHLTDASRKAMEQAVRAFGNSLKNPDAIGMFYYSGHGAQAGGANYLIPVDADIQDADELAYSAVDAESILAKMRSAGNKINIVVLDACRDNPFPGSSRSAEKGLAVVKIKVPESVIVYATDPGSTASDGTGRNSPFTKAFLENMDAPGQDISVMMKRVTSRVRTDTDGKQTPWVSTNLTKDFAFKSVMGSAAASSVQPAERPTMTVTRFYSSLVVTTATEGTLYLDGKAMGDVPAGAKAKLDSVEVGSRSLEVRYADGQVEQHTATAEAGSAASVSFTYRKAPPAQGGSARRTTDFFDLARTGTPQDVWAAINRGADIKASDKDGKTPLIWAARENQKPEVITALLEAGANLEARDSYYGKTALMWAARDNPKAEVTTVLLESGADINARDMNGETALMAAAEDNPNPEVITTLLAAGADAKAMDGAGRTAYDYAQGNQKLKGTDAFSKLYSAHAQPAAAAEGQATSLAEVFAAKAGPKDALRNGDSLPQASIKIDGNFDDWNGIPPAFTGGIRSPESENLAIEKVYLAVDEKNLYMRFDIRDITPSSFLHPNNFNTGHKSSYGVYLVNGTNQVVVKIYYSLSEGRWFVLVGRVVGENWKTVDSATGNYAMKGPTFEAAFPLEPIRRNLGAASGSCIVGAYTGYDNAQGNQLVEGSRDSTETKLLNF